MSLDKASLNRAKSPPSCFSDDEAGERVRSTSVGPARPQN
jgi:hypothetical protein